MIIAGQNEFANVIQQYGINSEYIVIKPNWVSNNYGEFTEAEILDWLLEALPKTSKKIIIESYTPWRGLKFQSPDSNDELKTDLTEGKKYWDFYKTQDNYFLESTGIGKILNKHKATYINITDEYWKGNCVNKEEIMHYLNGKKLNWSGFYSYVPSKLWEIKDKVTFISLAKIKLEEGNQNIVVSLSIKNLFGLIPHPSRRQPFHQDQNHVGVPGAVVDIFNLYNSIFSKTLWINEGIKTMIKNYCEKDQKIEENQNLLFAGDNAVKVDIQTCQHFNIDPKTVPYLNQLYT